MSGRSRRSDVRARVPLLALAPGSFQIVIRDGCGVDIVVRCALDVDETAVTDDELEGHGGEGQ